MEQYRFLIVGAHPDDMELLGGGFALRMRKKGHRVMFLSMTDGSAGHQTMTREALAQRRKEETEALAKIYDIEYQIMPIEDGRLEATVENREALIRKIRGFAPHMILTHRTVDYHPDHRACGQLVMDCSYLVKVPLICPDAPCPGHTPVIMSFWDRFALPVPFRPDVLVPIDDVVEQKIDGILCHVSQFYEWLPYANGWKDMAAAKTFEEKTACLRERMHVRFSNNVRLYPDLIPEGVQYAEAFQWNEYGAQLTEELRRVMTE